MRLSQWRAVLETEAATRDQVGAIQGEFRRLEVGDRAERLAVSAALLGLDDLDSTRDLTMGAAGQLYRMLLVVRDREQLLAAAGLADEDQADEHDDQPGERAGRPTLVAAMVRALVLASSAGPGFRACPVPGAAHENAGRGGAEASSD